MALSRFRLRQERELLQTTEEEEVAVDHPLRDAGDGAGDEGVPAVETVSDEFEDEDADVENQRPGGTDEARPTASSAAQPAANRRRAGPGRRTMSLADLEEERELSRRRTSACVLIACFVLFRLWIEAVTKADFTLLLMCLVGTSWTARFIRHNREREEELDRLITGFSENPDENGEIDRNDVRMMSFQAQLALAILESQRQMTEGVTDGGRGSSGVSEEAMRRWNKFEYKEGKEAPKGSAGYDATHSDVGDVKGLWERAEDAPHCSICLAEYEDGDKLVCLPCNHIYHEDCIKSWCSAHTTCPLDNLELEV